MIQHNVYILDPDHLSDDLVEGYQICLQLSQSVIDSALAKINNHAKEEKNDKVKDIGKYISFQYNDYMQLTYNFEINNI